MGNQGCASRTLERESKFLWTLAHLIMRHADTHPLLRPLTRERTSVQKVRTYLEEHSAENVSLEQLATLADMSPFHLLRVFRDAIGLTPHRYVTHIRVTQARQLLATTMPLAEIAGAVGFTDQSHYGYYRYLSSDTGIDRLDGMISL